MAVFGNKNISRLDVAMNDSLSMGSDESVSNVDGNVEEWFQLQRLTSNPLLQAFPFQLLHHDEGVTVVVLNLINGANVGMVQLRRSPGFALKALYRFFVAQQVFRNELQRNVAPQADVFGLVHNSHTTTAKFAYDAIVGDGLPDHGKAPPSRRLC